MRTENCQKAARILLLKSSGESAPDEDLFHKEHVSRCAGCTREMKALNALLPLEEKCISGEALEIIKSSSRAALPGKKNPARFRRFVLKPALAAFAAGIVVFFALGLPRERADDFTYSAEVEYDLLDERLISSENSVQALKIELFSDAGGFY